MPSAVPFILYYSSYETYSLCPQRFLWGRGWPGIDLGAGPGKRKPVPVERSMHHAIMGIVIQRAIEKLYNDELWKDAGTLLPKLMGIVESELTYEIRKSYVNWKESPPQSELLAVCKAGVHGYLKTMKAHRLLGPFARAEVDMSGWIEKKYLVGGRADVVIRRPDDGTTILDGKNSEKKGKYTSPDQVRWYAMCYKFSTGKMPDRIGFTYFRYPYGMPREDGGVEEGVDWIPCSEEDIQGLALAAADVYQRIITEDFDPTPSPKNCKFCDYESVCDARKDQKSANRRPRTKPDLPVIPGTSYLNFGKT